MTPRAWSGFVAVLCTACAGSGAYQVPGPEERTQLQREVETLARESESLLRTQDELVWKTWKDGTPVDIAATYEGKAALFTPEAVRKVETLRSATSDAHEVRALTHLKVYLAGEYVASRLAEVSDALASLDADAAYRDLDLLLANERVLERRRALYANASAAIERHVPLFKRRAALLEQSVKTLGYPSYEAFGRELRQTDLEALAALANRILDATQTPYLAVMGRLSQAELELPFEKLHRADIPRLFRPRGVDARFPREQLLARVQSTLGGMGFDLRAMKNVQLDLTDSPRKNPRGITLPIRVPSDIRVSLRPAPGVDAQASYLHEAGHALHDAYTQERRFELAKLGNIAIPETFALLFEDLVTHPQWLEENAGMTGEQRASYLAASAGHRLFLLRRTAGRLLYQVELHREALKDPKVDSLALYAKVMARTYQLPMAPEDAPHAWVDEEDFYASADTFRAWFLAAQLEAHLASKFGAAWWKNKEAGKALQALWAPGNGVSPEELATHWGDPGLRTEPLLGRLGAALGMTMGAAPAKASR